MLVNISLHLLLGPGIHRTLRRNLIFLHIIFNQLIRTETGLTALAIHQRIRKASQVSGSHPSLGVHKNRTVHTYIVGILLYKLLPPGTLYIVLKLHTQITVIPGIGEAAVDLGAGINKSPSLCQSRNLVHCLFHYSISSSLIYK